MAQFEALLDRRHEEHRRHMAAAGEVAAAVYNTNRSQPSDPVLSAADFIPKSLGEVEEPEADPDIDAVAEFFGARKK